LQRQQFEMLVALMPQEPVIVGVLPCAKLADFRMPTESGGGFFGPLLQIVNSLGVVQATHMVVIIGFPFEFSSTGVTRISEMGLMDETMLPQTFVGFADLLANITNKSFATVIDFHMSSQNVEFREGFSLRTTTTLKLPIQTVELSMSVQRVSVLENQEANGTRKGDFFPMKFLKKVEKINPGVFGRNEKKTPKNFFFDFTSGDWEEEFFF
jgi:hypothetical protein